MSRLWVWAWVLLLGALVGKTQAFHTLPLSTPSVDRMEVLHDARADRGSPRTTTTVRYTAPRANQGSVRTPSALLDRIGGCECCGDPTAQGGWTTQNRHSTASGRWQFLDTTWAGFGGYKRARDAPPDVQTAKAVMTFQASGTRPWISSASCWR